MTGPSRERGQLAAGGQLCPSGWDFGWDVADRFTDAGYQLFPVGTQAHSCRDLEWRKKNQTPAAGDRDG